MKFIQLLLSISTLLFLLNSCEKDKLIIHDSPVYAPGSDTIFNIKNLQITNGVNEIILNWDSYIYGAKSYQIFRSTDKINFELIANSIYQSYTDHKNLERGKKYYYKVNAITNENNLSFFSVIDSGATQLIYQKVRTFGSFIFGYGIVFDSKDNSYITDRTAGKIKMYNANYQFVKDILVSPNPLFQRVLRGIAWTNDSNLVVVNSSGGEIIEVTTNDSIIGVYNVSNSSILREVDVDSQGNFYITDVDNKNIVKLNQNGVFQKTWKMNGANSNSSFYPSGLEIIDNQLLTTGVNGNRSLEYFNFNGDFIKSFNLSFTGAYISKDANKNLYIANFGHVSKISKNGVVLANIGVNEISRAVAVAVNSKGLVFISDENQSTQIHVFKEI